jgi:mannose-6-phosphate isomerase-like protein (cupin superfamily)
MSQDVKEAPPKVDPDALLGEWPKQKFTVSHYREADFKTGLRSYVQYRDLGMRAATGGMVDAHVNRRNGPFVKELVVQRHYHEVRFQMVYVLKGWTRFEVEGEGEHLVEAGGCWIQPAGIHHTVLGYSDDLEVLEVTIPADYATVNVENRPQDQ